MAASVAATATATAAACGAARGGAPTESGCGAGVAASRGAGRGYPGGASPSGRDGLLRGKGGKAWVKNMNIHRIHNPFSVGKHVLFVLARINSACDSQSIFKVYLKVFLRNPVSCSSALYFCKQLSFNTLLYQSYCI